MLVIGAQHSAYMYADNVFRADPFRCATSARHLHVPRHCGVGSRQSVHTLPDRARWHESPLLEPLQRPLGTGRTRKLRGRDYADNGCR